MAFFRLIGSFDDVQVETAWTDTVGSHMPYVTGSFTFRRNFNFPARGAVTGFTVDQKPYIDGIPAEDGEIGAGFVRCGSEGLGI
jgi:hypothetical protein